ncbi:MAG TPA: hypothetical protein VF126_16105 [Acidobacteriaceae bacterium]|jgi:hypothetical protein
MKRTKAARPKAATPAKSKQKQSATVPVDVDRRGKVLPARQRVGGIITPQ